MGKRSTIATEHFPVVVITMAPEVGVADLEELGAQLRALYARQKKFVGITDMRATTKLPDAKTRQAIADWWKSFEADQRRWNLGSANIVSSAPVRGALTAITWLFSPPSPQTYVSTMTEAILWASARLHEADLELPRSIEALRAAG